MYKASPAVFNLIGDDDGLLFFGTNKGVVIFDGERWSLIPVSNFSDVKCLQKSPDGKIYVGANGNFGYLQKNVQEDFRYISLADSLPEKHKNFNDVWQIVFLNDKIYFQTYRGIFTYHQGNLTFDEIIDVYIFDINNKLFASSYVTGEFGRFIDGAIQPMNNFPDLSGDLIFQVFDYDENNYLMATSENGLFLLDKITEDVTVFESEVNNYLKKYNFYDGLKIRDDLYGFGSWTGGIAFIDDKGDVKHVFDQSNGLYANHVYDMSMGKNNDLWLATSNGISRISLDSLGFANPTVEPKPTFPLIKSINFSLNNNSINLYQVKDADNVIEESYAIENGIVNIYQSPSSMSFYYSSPGFAGEESSYAVFLDGYDTKWSNWNQNPVKEYTNLKSGNYTFYIQAKKNVTGHLSEISSININIITPWYQSIWIKVVIICVILAGIYAIIRLMMLRLKTQNVRLERIVDERTQDLIEQQQKLSSLNKYLTLTNKELDSFVYHTSHDLKAPLKSVLGLLDLAKREDAEQKFAQYHNRMEASVHKLEEFISSIIQYSANSKSEVHIKEIDFNKLIENAISEIQFHEAFDKIKISKNIQTNGDFYSDKKRIQIVLNNLISNSIKYYDKNKQSPHIKIEIYQDNGTVHMAIEDNGIGIKEEFQDKVFKMFYRASEKSYGSGLGLYIIHETVKKLNGSIHLESKEGQYCKFSIVLPNSKQEVII